MSCIADTPCGGDSQQEQILGQQEPAVQHEHTSQDFEMIMSTSSASSPNTYYNDTNNVILSCSSHSDCHKQFCSNSNGGYEGTCVDCLFKSNIGCRATEVCASSPTTGMPYCQDRPIVIESHDEVIVVTEEEVDGQQPTSPPPQPQHQNPQDNSFFCGLTYTDITDVCLQSKPCPTGIAALHCGPKEGCFSHATCKLQYDTAAASSSQSINGSATMSAFAAFDNAQTEKNIVSKEGEQGGATSLPEAAGDNMRFWTVESWNSVNTSFSSRKVSSLTVVVSGVLLMLLSPYSI